MPVLAPDDLSFVAEILYVIAPGSHPHDATSVHFRPGGSAGTSKRRTMENFDDGFRNFRSYVVSLMGYAGIRALGARGRRHRDGTERDAGAIVIS